MDIRLGCQMMEEGARFALFSANAEAVELCLFDSPASSTEKDRIRLEVDSRGVWSTTLPGIAAGTPYAYRVHGPFDPERGHLFNPSKLLFDPYARCVARRGRWDPRLKTGSFSKDGKRFSIDESDTADIAPLASVPPPFEAIATSTRPSVSRAEMVLYELHVKGMTKLHHLIPEEIRGTYRGLAHERVLEYLKSLGVTTVELLPVHFCFDEPHLQERGLRNYWGYSTLGYFAPDPRFAQSEDPFEVLLEFREMVQAFHAAGLEVLLDVVYNHSCEGGPEGPTVAFRGIDNHSYYRLDPKNRIRYVDYTGCGNTLDSRHPRMLALQLDSLRYWVEFFDIDGFRFDLAPVLGRGRFDMDPEHGFFQVLAQDALLSEVKLLAEPWDLGTYQLGHFPTPWLEWNGQFRDTVRSYWRNEPLTAARLATRLAGSSDLFGTIGRGAHAGVNFITCHDGFTLRDLVSYERKHNEANGEQNRDGTNDNRSWNCGKEGVTKDPEIAALRLRQQKNFFLTLFMSAGVPMLSHGDEVSHTKKGNNNTYCQDNELSWIDWQTKDKEQDLRDFVRQLAEIRASNPTLRRNKFFDGVERNGERDISWWDVDGEEIAADDWDEKEIRAFAVLYGRCDPGLPSGELQQRALLLLLNPSDENQIFSFSRPVRAASWKTRVSTGESVISLKGGTVALQAHAAVLLQTSAKR